MVLVLVLALALVRTQTPPRRPEALDEFLSSLQEGEIARGGGVEHRDDPHGLEEPRQTLRGVEGGEPRGVRQGRAGLRSDGHHRHASTAGLRARRHLLLELVDALRLEEHRLRGRDAAAAREAVGEGNLDGVAVVLLLDPPLADGLLGLAEEVREVLRRGCFRALVEDHLAPGGNVDVILEVQLTVLVRCGSGKGSDGRVGSVGARIFDRAERRRERAAKAPARSGPGGGRRAPSSATMHACDGLMKSLRSPSFTAPENCVMVASTAGASASDRAEGEFVPAKSVNFLD